MKATEVMDALLRQVYSEILLQKNFYFLQGYDEDAAELYPLEVCINRYITKFQYNPSAADQVSYRKTFAIIRRKIKGILLRETTLNIKFFLLKLLIKIHPTEISQAIEKYKEK